MDSNDIRLRLHALLVSKFPDMTVYYRPPGDVLLSYPCIRYERVRFVPTTANSATYTVGEKFQVMFLSLLPGYSNTRAMFDLHGSNGVIIEDDNEYETNDIVHTVFTVTVN